jgi:hypothetical protein
VPAFVSIDEILHEKRYIAGLQIATPTQFLDDVRRYVLRPSLNGVEGDDPARAFVLAGEQVLDDGIRSAVSVPASRQTRPLRPRSSSTSALVIVAGND